MEKRRPPEQIAGWLKYAYPGNEDYQVSHETIYRTLYIQARGALKKELLAHLRRTRAMRIIDIRTDGEIIDYHGNYEEYLASQGVD